MFDISPICKADFSDDNICIYQVETYAKGTCADLKFSSAVWQPTFQNMASLAFFFKKFN